MQEYTIRAATASDAKALSLLYRRVWDDYRGQFPSELLIERQPDSDAMLKWMKEAYYFLATVNDNVVGVIGCKLEYGTCQLLRMVVDKSHRQQGIRRRLMQKGILFAQENNAAKVWLDTLPFLEEAVLLHKKMGLNKCGYLQKHLWGLDLALYEKLIE